MYSMDLPGRLDFVIQWTFLAKERENKIIQRAGTLYYLKEKNHFCCRYQYTNDSKCSLLTGLFWTVCFWLPDFSFSATDKTI